MVAFFKNNFFKIIPTRVEHKIVRECGSSTYTATAERVEAAGFLTERVHHDQAGKEARGGGNTARCMTTTIGVASERGRVPPEVGAKERRERILCRRKVDSLSTSDQREPQSKDNTCARVRRPCNPGRRAMRNYPTTT
ncbi:hypothetical protein CBL_00296 [Carabus blaptoides fortunei]